MIAVSDAEGPLLEVIGDDACRRRLVRQGLLPGSNWSEASAGTNAIGVALATKRVVQLVGAEHYCAGWQDVTCTAAPIFHPDDSRLVGVIDITSNYRQARPLLTGVMAAAAADVQRRYRLEQVKKPVQSRFFQGWSPPLLQMPAAHQSPDPLARLALAVHRISAAPDPAQTPVAIAEPHGMATRCCWRRIGRGRIRRRASRFFLGASGEGEREQSNDGGAARRYT